MEITFPLDTPLKIFCLVLSLAYKPDYLIWFIHRILLCHGTQSFLFLFIFIIPRINRNFKCGNRLFLGKITDLFKIRCGFLLNLHRTMYSFCLLNAQNKNNKISQCIQNAQIPKQDYPLTFQLLFFRALIHRNGLFRGFQQPHFVFFRLIRTDRTAGG